MDTPSLPSDFDALADGDGQDYARLWALLRRTDEERGAAYDVDAEWDRLADRLDLDDADATSSKESASSEEPPSAPDRRAADREARSPASAASRRSRWPQVLTVAALLLCIVGGGLLWWSQPVTVATAAGERTVVTLPDGSTAELNGATTIEYPRGFASLPMVGSSARRVRLEGEAFFSVVERDRPFRVETPNARVEVVGTEFNVHAPRDNIPTTRVTVASGRVRVAGADAEGPSARTPVVLDKSGQTSQVVGIGGTPTPPETINLKYVQAWRQGGFGVVGAPLPAVLRELERRFDTTLRLRVPAAATDTMTLHYARDARLTDILRDVCLLQNLTFRETSRGYELVGK
jgi:transmembrane sensor